MIQPTSCILHPAVVMVTERLQDDTAAAVADTLAIGPFFWRPIPLKEASQKDGDR